MLFGLQDTPEAVSDLGEMLVSLLYNENLHRLSVAVIEARRVKVSEREREREGEREREREREYIRRVRRRYSVRGAAFTSREYLPATATTRCHGGTDHCQHLGKAR